MNITKEQLINCIKQSTETYYEESDYYAVEEFTYINPESFIEALNELQEGWDG